MSTHPPDLYARAQAIADRAVICDIESEGHAETIGGVTYYDIRPLVDEREVSPECADMARESIDYALARGLVARHPHHAHLLRIVNGA